MKKKEILILLHILTIHIFERFQITIKINFLLILLFTFKINTSLQTYMSLVFFLGQIWILDRQSKLGFSFLRTNTFIYNISTKLVNKFVCA